MLSALLKRLSGIRKEAREEYRSALMTLCVSAFPDIRPWQVKKACLTEYIDEEDVSQRSEERESFDFDELYYEYLSQLLHPTEGHEMARHDPKQVEVSADVRIGISNGNEALPNSISCFYTYVLV